MAIKQSNLYTNSTDANGYKLVSYAATSASRDSIQPSESVTEGDLWYDTTSNILKSYDGTNWSPAGLQSQSAGSLNDAAAIGGTITVDGSTVAADFAVTVSAGGGDVCATFTQNDVTNNGVGVYLVNTGTGVTLDFASSANTYDIQGSADTWDITRLGHADFVAGVGIDADSAALTFGESDDVTIQFVDGASIGTAGAGLMFATASTAEQIQFGDNTTAFDIIMVGTSVTNSCQWDASADKLIFNDSDIHLGDSDKIMFGDQTTSGDVMIRWDGVNLDVLPQLDNTQIVFGTNALAMDMQIWGATTTSYLQWYSTGDRLVFGSGAAAYDTGLQLDDYVGITFGEGANFATSGDGDWQIYCSGATNTPLTIIPTANDSIFRVGNAGGTLCADLQWYTDTPASGFFIDSSTDKVYLDAADLHLGDDDYIVFGDQGAAGSTADATIRWDSTELEIIGATRFEQGVTMDTTLAVTGNLSVGGNLAVTGGWEPGSLSLEDGENMNFGDSDDITIEWDGTSNALTIEGAAEGTGIRIGATNSQDVWFYGDTNSAYIQYDGTSNALMCEGTDIIMMNQDVIEFGDALNWAIWTDSATTSCFVACTTANGTVTIGDGTVGCDFRIENTNVAAADVWWDNSAETFYFGKNDEGVDVYWYGDAASSYMYWDETNNYLRLEAADLVLGDDDMIILGDTAGTGDFTISVDSGDDLSIKQVSGGTGDILLGVSGKGIDTWFYGETAAVDVTWDQSEGAFTFADNAVLSIGATGSNPDLAIYSDGTSGSIELGANTNITGDAFILTIGNSGSNGMDVVFQGASEALSQVIFDAGDQYWSFGAPGGASDAQDGIDVIFPAMGHTTTGADNVTFDSGNARWIFGTYGGTSNCVDGIDVVFQAEGSTGDNSVLFDSGAEKWTFGSTVKNGVDVVFTGASEALSTCYFDAGDQSFYFGSEVGSSGIQNGIDVAFMSMKGASTAPNGVLFDSGNARWTFGTYGGVTTANDGIDVIFQAHGDTGDNPVTFDSGAQSWTFGGVSTDDGIDVVFTGGSGSDTVTWDAGTGGGRWSFGTYGGGGTAANGIDVIFQATDGTTDNAVTWDAGAASWTFGNVTTTNGVDVIFQGQTTKAQEVKWDAGLDRWTFGTYGGAGTACNGVDVVFQAHDGTTDNKITFDSGAASWSFGNVSCTTDNGIDVTFTGGSEPTSLIGWDAGNQVMSFGTSGGVSAALNGIDVHFMADGMATTCPSGVHFDSGLGRWSFGTYGGYSGEVQGIDVVFQADGSTGDNSIVFDSGAETWTFGSTVQNGVDVVFQSCSATAATVKWDSGEQSWVSAAGCDGQFFGDTTQATITKGLAIPLVDAAPTSCTANVPDGVAYVCFYKEANGTSGTLYVKGDTTGAWLAVTVT